MAARNVAADAEDCRLSRCAGLGVRNSLSEHRSRAQDGDLCARRGEAPLAPRPAAAETRDLSIGGRRVADLRAPADPTRPGFRAVPFEAVALDLSNLWKW